MTSPEYKRLDLSVRDSQAFVDALVSPKAVDDRLRETVARYRETTEGEAADTARVCGATGTARSS
ncbi:DUF1778 domain-containing protein [Mesorhizobium sanjuanii]|uniref:type II toxin -antitoxin system TacA 1-like antitoxin n=1 Tax=Mesorhizobium sanjuanii TaxID=2037900 RepID=UPI000E1D029F|nr:DUF1778 domain-containing protein [Mesorhizobium sanjuanii]